MAGLLSGGGQEAPPHGNAAGVRYRDDLASVVHAALEPAHVSVWVSELRSGIHQPGRRLLPRGGVSARHTVRVEVRLIEDSKIKTIIPNDAGASPSASAFDDPLAARRSA